MNAVRTLGKFLDVPVLYFPTHHKLIAILDSDRGESARQARAGWVRDTGHPNSQITWRELLITGWELLIDWAMHRYVPPPPPK